MPAGNLLYAQSGGVTAVINATASAVLQTARAKKVRVLAARNGILGALREELFDTTTSVSYTHLDVYKRQTASFLALSSTRELSSTRRAVKPAWLMVAISTAGSAMPGT